MLLMLFFEIFLLKIGNLKMSVFESNFLNFVIWFYRMNGITFGGICLDDQRIIKSKFWYYFGYFGCCLHITLSLIITALIFYMSSLTSKNSTAIVKIMWLFRQLIKPVMTIFISIAIQKHGFQIINILMKYSLTKFNKLKTIAIIWCIHLVMSIFIFALGVWPNFNLFGFIISYYHDIILISLMCSISFMSWIVSVNFTENIKIIKKRLNNNFITANLLEEAKLITIYFENIKKIDQLLTMGFISLAVGIICIILQFVHLLIVFSETSLFLVILPFQLYLIILIILNCIINSNVMEEALKLHSALDNIKINVNNDQLYESLISLKTSIYKLGCGFSIGGFAPWNKLTLLNVRNYNI